MSRPIPEALLERYLAGDVSPEQQRELDERIAASPDEQARVRALKADTAAFLLSHPPGPTVAKLEAKRPGFNWLAWLAAPLAAAVAALLFVFQRPVEDDFSIKGDVVLAVYRQAESGEGERLPSGATLKAGDKVRFEVRAPKDGWVAVISRDGAGHVTTYYPYDGQAAARYSAADSLLPGAVGLDETKGTEEVWVLYSPKPFTLGTYVELLEKGGTPAFSKDVAASRVSWVKQ